MIFTLDKFIEHLKELCIVGIEVIDHDISMGESYDLPDVRTGAIYPPQPCPIRKGYVEKPYNILKCKLWKDGKN